MSPCSPVFPGGAGGRRSGSRRSLPARGPARRLSACWCFLSAPERGLWSVSPMTRVLMLSNGSPLPVSASWFSALIAAVPSSCALHAVPLRALPRGPHGRPRGGGLRRPLGPVPLADLLGGCFARWVCRAALVWRLRPSRVLLWCLLQLFTTVTPSSQNVALGICYKVSLFASFNALALNSFPAIGITTSASRPAAALARRPRHRWGVWLAFCCVELELTRCPV